MTKNNLLKREVVIKRAPDYEGKIRLNGLVKSGMGYLTDISIHLEGNSTFHINVMDALRDVEFIEE